MLSEYSIIIDYSNILASSHEFLIKKYKLFQIHQRYFILIIMLKKRKNKYFSILRAQLSGSPACEQQTGLK